MNILLINYDFPPNPGIGGRRWAKLAKSLAKAGHEIYVVKADFPDTASPSSWEQDVRSSKIHVFSAARTYPRILSHPSQSLKGRIEYRIRKWQMLVREKGTIYDQSIGWDSTMLPLCRELIRKNNIQTIIASGAPWNLLGYAASLKKEFPSLRFLADYRDPWLTARNYGMANLSDARKKAEEHKQRIVFELADVVTTPYAYLTKELATWCSKNCEHAPRFETLEHFFDPDDFTMQEESSVDGSVFRLMYAGDMYLGSEPQWGMLAKIISSQQTNRINGGKAIHIDIFTSANIPSEIQKLENVHVHAPIGKGVFERMQKASALLIVLPENKKNERTTKFYEYLPLRKPLLVIAPPGAVTDFVEKNKLGIHSAQSEEVITHFFSDPFSIHSFNSEFDLSEHTADHRATEILNLLA